MNTVPALELIKGTGCHYDTEDRRLVVVIDGTAFAFDGVAKDDAERFAIALCRHVARDTIQ